MSKIILDDNNKDHKYFCILQNILSHLELNAYERSLYWAIKEACGECGECTKSHDTLCKIAGMGVTKLKETILSLARPNPILNKPLIVVTQRTTVEGIKVPNKITLTDLWDDNIRFFKEKINQSPRDYRQSPDDRGYSRHATGVWSPRDYKEEPTNKNPLKKNPPPSVPEKTEGEEKNRKNAIGLAKLCKEKKLPFTERKVTALYNQFPQACLEVINEFAKRKPDNMDLKFPDSWLNKHVREQHEFLEQKKDYE